MTNKHVHNAQSGEITFVSFSSKELAKQQEIFAATEAFIQAEAQIKLLKVSAKSKLVLGQPLTEEEANLILGSE